jgi:hypothetical protein
MLKIDRGVGEMNARVWIVIRTEGEWREDQHGDILFVGSAEAHAIAFLEKIAPGYLAHEAAVGAWVKKASAWDAAHPSERRWEAFEKGTLEKSPETPPAFKAVSYEIIEREVDIN